jgi:hypothetical protein
MFVHRLFRVLAFLVGTLLLVGAVIAFTTKVARLPAVGCATFGALFVWYAFRGQVKD